MKKKYEQDKSKNRNDNRARVGYVPISNRIPAYYPAVFPDFNEVYSKTFFRLKETLKFYKRVEMGKYSFIDQQKRSKS